MSIRNALSLATLSTLLVLTACGSSSIGAVATSGAAARAKADLYVSPSGSDEGRCSRRAPCRSFDRAYRVARPGDTVQVAGGRYRAQTVEADASKTSSKDVVFRPAPGARVELEGALEVSASHIEFRGLRATIWKSAGGADQTFRGLDVRAIYVQGSKDVTVVGGDIGPTVDHDSQVTSRDGAVPTGIVFDSVFFHDARKVDPSAHVECLQFGAGIDVVIRRSRFVRCSDHDVFVRSWGTIGGEEHPLRGFLIENNFFGKTTRGHYSLRLSPQTGQRCEDFLIRNNSALQNMYSDCEADDVRFLANIQPTKSEFSCTKSEGSVWDWNVYGSGVACGPNDIVGTMGFRRPGRLDLHLKPGAAALGRAAPGETPRVDIDGQARPRGGTPDAGADER